MNDISLAFSYGNGSLNILMERLEFNTPSGDITGEYIAPFQNKLADRTY
ncbi:MAG: hypothetical protein ACOYOE_04145 [Chlorobium sp.]